MSIKDKKLIVLDMDGTIYLGNNILEGSLEFLDEVLKHNKEYVFFTNNSLKDKNDYLKKLRNMKILCNENNMLSSADVTIDYIKRNYKDESVFLVGTKSLKKGFEKEGVSIKRDSDIVVLGFDTELTYDKISHACTLIRNGAVYIATHPDFNCPTENGPIPDIGAMIEMIYASTGIRPKILGKPNRETLEFIESKTGFKKDEMLLVGDRLYTEIKMGYDFGVETALVLSGETNIEMVKESDEKPDYIFNGICDIIKHL